MAETNQHSSDPSNPEISSLQGTKPPTPPAAPKRKRRGWWWKIPLILIVLLLLLILCAPMIVSSSPVRSIILSQVNGQLNGKVKLDDLSVGWTSGLSIKGLKVFDDQNAQILELATLDVPVSLIDAAKGKYDLKQITVDGLNGVLKVDENGRINFMGLVKQTKEAVKEAAPQVKSEPGKLPEVTGSVLVKNSRFTIEQAGKPPVFVDAIDASIKIAGINLPIDSEFAIKLRVGTEGKPGTIKLTGKSAVVANNQIDPNLAGANVDQKLEISQVDLASTLPFLPPKLLDALKGIANGTIAINLTNGKSATIEGLLTVDGMSAGGPALKGDQYVSKQVNLTIPKTTIDMPQGPMKWEAFRAILGTEQSPLIAKLDQAEARLFVDLQPQSILDVLADKKPGVAGKVSVVVDANAGQLAGQMPRLFHLVEGVALTGGQLHQQLDIVLTPDDARVTTLTSLKDVAGTRDGAKISLQPIEFSSGLTSIGGIGKVPRLRDLKLTLKSAFASADFAGTTPADLKGTAKAELSAMQKELSQVVDFKDLKLAGMVDVLINSQGDLTKDDGFSDATLKATVQNLQVTGLAGKAPLIQPRIETNISVHAVRGPENFIDQVQKITITTQTGDAAAPTLDLLAVGNVDLRGGTLSATFEVSKLNVDAARVHKEFGALIPALAEQKMQLLSGILSVNLVDGQFKAKTLTVGNASMQARGLSVTKNGNAIVSNYTLTTQTAVVVTLGDAIQARLSKLTVSDSTNLLGLSKSNDGDVTFAMAKDGKLSATGGLQVGADLAELNRIAQVFAEAPAAKTGQVKPGQVKTGRLDGTIKLATPGTINVDGDFNVSNLVVTTEKGVTDPQAINVKLLASAGQDFKTISVTRINIASKLVTADITDVQANLAAKVVFDLVSKANVKVNIPDVPALYTMASAFLPPAAPTSPTPIPAATPGTPAKTDAAPVEAPLPPMQFTGGTFSLAANVDHSAGGPINVSVSNLNASGLAFKRGTVVYQAQPIDVKLAAAINTAGTDIKQIQVITLDGKLGIASLTMPKPIIINDPLGTPTAQGAIKLDGKLEDATAILEAMAGKKAGELYPYKGVYALNQTLGTQGKSAITLKGSAQISKFVVLGKKDQPNVFAEDLIDVKNDLQVDLPGKLATINTLSVKMTSSDALALNLAGGVSDWELARNIKDVKLDVTYDLAKLWPIIKPMMTPAQQEQYKDLQIAGKHSKTFIVKGSYPANVPMTQAIQSLTAYGSVAVQLFDYNGLNVQNLELPVSLSKGQLVTVYGDKPAGQNLAPLAIANSGKLDLNQISVDLTVDPPRVSTPPDKAVLTGATINPVFARTWMAKVINNPIFAGAQQATGVLDLKINSCDRLPAGDLVMQKVKANDGSAELSFAMNNLHIGLEGLSALKSVFHQDSFVARVRDGRIAIANGIVKQNLLFESSEFTLGFNGNVSLSDLKFVPMNVDLPTKWLVKRFKNDPNLLKWIPEQTSVVMKGSVTKPDLDTKGVIDKLITEALPKAAMGALLGDNKNKPPGDAKPGDPPKLDDPVKDLIDIFGGKKKDKKK